MSAGMLAVMDGMERDALRNERSGLGDFASQWIGGVLIAVRVKRDRNGRARMLWYSLPNRNVALGGAWCGEDRIKRSDVAALYRATGDTK